ncbi:Histone H2B [Dictyocoela muelleri]|nr:Histone H2B [Dictyocoela muelleri]
MVQKVKDTKPEQQEKATPVKKDKKKQRLVSMEPGKFRSSIRRLVKEVYDNTHLSSAALDCLCGISKCVVDDIADLSGELCKKVGRTTVGTQDIMSAFQLFLGKGELAQHCINEIKDTITKSQLNTK